MSLSGELPERKLQYWGRRRWLPARRSQSTKDLALLEMEVVLIEIPQRPGIVDIQKHAVRNCGLLFYFWLLADQPVFTLPIGRQCRRRLLSPGLLSGFLHRHYPCAANISHFCMSAMPLSYALTDLSRVPASSSPALSSHPNPPPVASSEQPSSDWPCDPGSCSDQRAPGPRWRTPWLHRRRGSRAGYRHSRLRRPTPSLRSRNRPPDHRRSGRRPRIYRESRVPEGSVPDRMAAAE